jgi:hypothetical protein
MRVRRGSLESERDANGRLYVWLDTDEVQTDASALISAKDETIAALRDQLEAERQAHAEARRLLMAALEHIPPQLEAPQEPEQETPASPGPNDSPAERGTAAQEPVSQRVRSWWKGKFCAAVVGMLTAFGVLAGGGPDNPFPLFGGEDQQAVVEEREPKPLPPGPAPGSEPAPEPAPAPHASGGGNGGGGGFPAPEPAPAPPEPAAELEPAAKL